MPTSLALSPLSDLRVLKSCAAISRELKHCFDVGLPKEESFELAVPKLDPRRSTFNDEWLLWEAERRVRNSAIMCGNG